MGLELEKLVVRIIADTKPLRSALGGMLKRIKTFAGNVKSAMTGIGGALIASLAGGAVGGFFAKAISSASDAQETMSKFETVFGTQSEAVKAFADQLANDANRSSTELSGMLASFQDLFVPLGFTSDVAEDMSKKLTGLTLDLASFNNKAEADVLNDLQAAMTGSSEVMKKYGVIVNETAVKQELMLQGLDPKNATETQKAMARLNIIMEGTTAAQGDAIRTADGFANQFKGLQAAVKDLFIAIGNQLLPTVTEIVSGMKDWIQTLTSSTTGSNVFADGIKTIINVILKARGIFKQGQSFVSGFFGFLIKGVSAAINTIIKLVNKIPGVDLAQDTLLDAIGQDLIHLSERQAKEGRKLFNSSYEDVFGKEEAQKASPEEAVESESASRQELLDILKKEEEERKRLKKEMKEQEKIEKKMADRAEKLLESARSPAEQLRADLAEVQELLQNENLTTEEARKVRENIGKDFFKNADRGSGSSPTLRFTQAGSVESFRARADAKKAAEAARMRERQLAALEKIAQNTDPDEAANQIIETTDLD